LDKVSRLAKSKIGKFLRQQIRLAVLLGEKALDVLVSNAR
jgi:hypothetical protein